MNVDWMSINTSRGSGFTVRSINSRALTLPTLISLNGGFLRLFTIHWGFRLHCVNDQADFG
ncbi:MAG: hypothetical protein CL862_02935 [Cyanobium sp. NAT70]|nr:hypothetical protein [Cyanobium sp. NAT70]